jgi:putative membrane protein
MFLDWLLASFHHLAVFSLAGILAAELVLTASVLDDRVVLRLARIDAWFGIVAAIALAAGLARVFFAAKGADYYAANTFFWIKMALFAAVAVISVAPTYSFIVWRRRVRAPSARRRGLAAAHGALRRSRAVRADPGLRRRHGPRLRHVRLRAAASRHCKEGSRRSNDD